MLRRSPKALLIELSEQLEREAMRLGGTCVVAAAFQEARHLTPSTTQRYRDLVERTGFVCALGEDLPAAQVVVGQPAAAGGEVAHVPVEHGDGGGGVLHEQPQPFVGLLPAAERADLVATATYFDVPHADLLRSAPVAQAVDDMLI